MRESEKAAAGATGPQMTLTRADMGESAGSRVTVNRSNSVKARLHRMTAADTADILTQLRQIVKGQIAQYAQASLSGPFSLSQASALHKIAQTFSLLESKTEREHEKYDFSGASKEDLAELERQAAKMLSAEGPNRDSEG